MRSYIDLNRPWFEHIESKVCPVCHEPFEDKLVVREHLMTHTVKEVRESGTLVFAIQ